MALATVPALMVPASVPIFSVSLWIWISLPFPAALSTLVPSSIPAPVLAAMPMPPSRVIMAAFATFSMLFAVFIVTLM